MKKVRMSIMVITIFVFLIGCFVVTPVTYAASKFGSIDMGQIFNGYSKTKETQKALDEKGERKKGEINKMVEEIRRLQDELELMSEKGREEKRLLIEEKSRKLRDFERDIREELLRERDKMAMEILTEIREFVEKYSKNNEYAFVIEKGALVYSIPQADITDKILEEMNANYKKWKK